MKQSPDMARTQEQMAPGVITAGGFLGDDDRNVTDIIEADRETMVKIGLDLEQAVPTLRHLMEEGRKGLGDTITVDGKWEVRVNEARGFIPSPFGDGIFRKVNLEINKKGSDKLLLLSELSLHMIEAQHFFQGKGSPFRIEPSDLLELLA